MRQVLAATWTFIGSMQQARNYFSATLLNNGQVLVVGGSYRGTFVQYGLTSAELYNPATGTFSPTGSLNTGRYGHTATLLNSGTGERRTVSLKVGKMAGTRDVPCRDLRPAIITPTTTSRCSSY